MVCKMRHALCASLCCFLFLVAACRGPASEDQLGVEDLIARYDIDARLFCECWFSGAGYVSPQECVEGRRLTEDQRDCLRVAYEGFDEFLDEVLQCDEPINDEFTDCMDEARCRIDAQQECVDTGQEALESCPELPWAAEGYALVECF